MLRVGCSSSSLGGCLLLPEACWLGCLGWVSQGEYSTDRLVENLPKLAGCMTHGLIACNDKSAALQGFNMCFSLLLWLLHLVLHLILHLILWIY